MDRSSFKKALSDLINEEFESNYEFVKDIPFFKQFSKSQLKNIVSHLVVNRYAKNEYIVREGEDANSYYIIKQGELAVLKDNKVINTMS